MKLHRPNSFEEGALFVWRGQSVYRAQGTEPVTISGIYNGYDHTCPFCKTRILDFKYPSKNICQICGFWFVHLWAELLDEGTQDLSPECVALATIKKLNINDADLALSELGTHLRRHPNDAYHLNSRRFEQLVADVYRNLGYSVRLTQQTHDSGYDILLLEAGSGKQTIVECKRFAEHRKVGINIVREILGVQLVFGIKQAKVITTSHFTNPARELTKKVNQETSGFDLELIDLDKLVTEMNVYNTKLPPLHLDPRFNQP